MYFNSNIQHTPSFGTQGGFSDKDNVIEHFI